VAARADNPKRAALAALIAAAALALASCAHETLSGESSVFVDTVPARPALSAPFVVQVVVRDDRHQKPMTGAKVEILGQMSHPGMAPVLVPASESAPGIFRGSVSLDMAGAWVLRITTTLPDGRRVQQNMDLDIKP